MAKIEGSAFFLPIFESKFQGSGFSFKCYYLKEIFFTGMWQQELSGDNKTAYEKCQNSIKMRKR